MSDLSKSGEPAAAVLVVFGMLLFGIWAACNPKCEGGTAGCKSRCKETYDRRMKGLELHSSDGTMYFNAYQACKTSCDQSCK